MRHMIILKVKSESDKEYIIKRTEETFEELGKLINGVKGYAVYSNCIVRDQNYDICGMVDFENEDILPEYLSHPLHVALVQEAKPLLAGMVSFDYK